MSMFSRSRRILGMMVLALVALGPVSFPVQAFGQEGKPAASSPQVENASGPLPAQPGQIKKEETEDENVYRHTALVQSLARTFHMDVEKTARLFEWINAGIILLAVIIPLAKILPRVMRKRSETLSEKLESARKTTTDANSRLSAVEAQLSHLDQEIAKIRSQVEEESKQDEVRIKASIGEESARIVAAAEQEIGVAAAQARRGLRTFAAELAIEQASQQLKLSPEQDRALIAEFVRNAEQGGQN